MTFVWFPLDVPDLAMLFGRVSLCITYASDWGSDGGPPCLEMLDGQWAMVVRLPARVY